MKDAINFVAGLCIGFAVLASIEFTRCTNATFDRRMERIEGHMQYSSDSLMRIKDQHAADAKRLDQLTASNEIMRAEAIREKARAEALHEFFNDMFKDGNLPFVPVPQRMAPGLIPPQKVPTKPID